MRFQNLIKSVDWTEIEHGETLRKFVAYDKSAIDHDFSVELHGFIDECGNMYITNEIVKRPESKSNSGGKDE